MNRFSRQMVCDLMNKRIMAVEEIYNSQSRSELVINRSKRTTLIRLAMDLGFKVLGDIQDGSVRFRV
jgi:hypothetical protein